MYLFEIDIDRLIDDLKKHGFGESIDNLVSLDSVLRKLPSDYDEDTLSNYLCTLFAKTPEEQKKFHEIFKRSLKPEIPDPEDQVGLGLIPRKEKEIKPKPIKSVLLIISSAFILIIAVYVCYRLNSCKDIANNFHPGKDSLAPNPIPYPPDSLLPSQDSIYERTSYSALKQDDYPLDTISMVIPKIPLNNAPLALNTIIFKYLFILGLIVIACFIEFKIISNRNKLKKLRSALKPPFSFSLKYNGTKNIILSNQFIEFAKGLNYHSLSFGLKINIKNSIASSIKSGGFAKLEYTPKKKRSEYLFLIDKSQKHLGSYYDFIFKKLEEYGVPVEKFYYSYDLSGAIWRENKTGTYNLKTLSNVYSEHILFICGNSQGLLDPATGALKKSLADILLWQSRFLIVPSAQEKKSTFTNAGAEYFNVLEFNNTGFSDIIEILYGTISTDLSSKKHAIRSLTDTASDPETMIETLKNELGGQSGYFSLFEWIAACSLMPDLSWEFTILVGEALSESSNNLLSVENIYALSCIKWFRQGEMPEDIRILLYKALPEEARNNVISALIDALNSTELRKESYASELKKLVLSNLNYIKSKDAKDKKGYLKNINDLQFTSNHKDVLSIHLLNNHTDGIFDKLILSKLKGLIYRQGNSTLGVRRGIMWFTILIISGLSYFIKPAIPACKESRNFDSRDFCLSDSNDKAIYYNYRAAFSDSINHNVFPSPDVNNNSPIKKYLDSALVFAPLNKQALFNTGIYYYQNVQSIYRTPASQATTALIYRIINQYKYRDTSIIFNLHYAYCLSLIFSIVNEQNTFSFKRLEKISIREIKNEETSLKMFERSKTDSSKVKKIDQLLKLLRVNPDSIRHFPGIIDSFTVLHDSVSHGRPGRISLRPNTPNDPASLHDKDIVASNILVLERIQKLLTINVPFGSNYQAVAIDEYNKGFKDSAHLPTAIECSGNDITYFWRQLEDNSSSYGSKYKMSIYQQLPIKSVFSPNTYIIHFFKNSNFYRTELRVYLTNFIDYYQLLDYLGIDSSMLSDKRNYYFNESTANKNLFCAVSINPSFNNEVKIIFGKGTAANNCSSDWWFPDMSIGMDFNYAYDKRPFVRRIRGIIEDPRGFRNALALLQPPKGAHGDYGTLGDDVLLEKESGYGLTQLGQLMRKYVQIDSLYDEQPGGYGSFIQSGVFTNVNQINDATLGWMLYDLRPQFEADLKRIFHE